MRPVELCERTTFCRRRPSCSDSADRKRSVTMMTRRWTISIPRSSCSSRAWEILRAHLDRIMLTGPGTIEDLGKWVQRVWKDSKEGSIDFSTFGTWWSSNNDITSATRMKYWSRSTGQENPASAAAKHTALRSSPLDTYEWRNAVHVGDFVPRYSRGRQVARHIYWS